MIVLTVISDLNHVGFFRLKASCALQNLALKTFVCKQDQYENKNHRSKDELIKNFLDELDEEEIILFTDGYDTLMLAEEKEILEKFSAAKTALLFSAEADCFPDSSMKDLYPPVYNGVYRFLNSGGYIGKAGMIKRILSEDISDVESNYSWSNQYSWTIRYLRNTDRIKLDSGCQVFTAFANEAIQNSLPDNAKTDEAYNRAFYNWFHTHYEISNGRIFNKITNTWPCNAHFNGQTSVFAATYPDCMNMLFDQIPGSKHFSIQHV